MIERSLYNQVLSALSRQAAVALIGPRQVGKTTLALQIAAQTQSLYMDLEDPIEREKLTNPGQFLAGYENHLVILDEIHRAPGLFPILRGLIDQGRRRGKRTGRFLLLGSASLDLLRQSGETLAGRITYLDMNPFNVMEVASQTEQLWIRGGFPDSFLAQDEIQSMAWRRDLVRTYLERDIPMFGPRIPAETLRRFWTMLAHSQGGLLNCSKLAASLEVSSPTINRYTDLLTDLLLLRRLMPYHSNVKKRLVKSPKIFIRDSGLLHSLLNLGNLNSLLGHPVAGFSWEGFVIENLIVMAPSGTVPGFYRTSGGAEIDLILELPGGKLWVMEIKRSLVGKPSRGFYEACEDLKPARKFLVHSGIDRYPLGEKIEAIGLLELGNLLAKLH
jgi:predicted AAA+ superfamily ATPase